MKKQKKSASAAQNGPRGCGGGTDKRQSDYFSSKGLVRLSRKTVSAGRSLLCRVGSLEMNEMRQRSRGADGGNLSVFRRHFCPKIDLARSGYRQVKGRLRNTRRTGTGSDLRRETLRTILYPAFLQGPRHRSLRRSRPIFNYCGAR